MKTFLRCSFLCAALWFGAHAQAQAPAGGGCAVDVEGRPGKKFSPDHIVVPAQCQLFTVRLIHAGKNSKEEAGHNWVLTRSDQTDAVMVDGRSAGVQHDWLQPGDGRVLAKTPMLGGHETATVSFPVSRLSAGTSYTYFCSFPAHAQQMRGTLLLGD